MIVDNQEDARKICAHLKILCTFTTFTARDKIIKTSRIILNYIRIFINQDLTKLQIDC